MKPEIKTRKNLESAFAGESRAYQKYLYFALLARKKGNEEVAKLFEDTAKHEIAHARGTFDFSISRGIINSRAAIANFS